MRAPTKVLEYQKTSPQQGRGLARGTTLVDASARSRHIHSRRSNARHPVRRYDSSCEVRVDRSGASSALHRTGLPPGPRLSGRLLRPTAPRHCVVRYEVASQSSRRSWKLSNDGPKQGSLIPFAEESQVQGAELKISLARCRAIPYTKWLRGAIPRRSWRRDSDIDQPAQRNKTIA
jgi:hypothetical protein